MTALKKVKSHPDVVDYFKELPFYSKHIWKIKNYITGRRVECKPSAVSDHLLLHNHDSDFSDFTVLCGDNNGFRFLLKEFISRSRDSPVLNKNTASIPLLFFD